MLNLIIRIIIIIFFHALVGFCLSLSISYKGIALKTVLSPYIGTK